MTLDISIEYSPIEDQENIWNYPDLQDVCAANDQKFRLTSSENSWIQGYSSNVARRDFAEKAIAAVQTPHPPHTLGIDYGIIGRRNGFSLPARTTTNWVVRLLPHQSIHDSAATARNTSGSKFAIATRTSIKLRHQMPPKRWILLRKIEIPPSR